MADFSHRNVTLSYQGPCGEHEFVLACKGRPFSVLTSPNYPTPDVTLVDYNLVRDLKIGMKDLQCAKFHFGGAKLRKLGKVSTSVQCILDGVPNGNMHFKAVVVQDLYQHFDTHAIAGNKLSKLLIEPSDPASKNAKNTEPTDLKSPGSPKKKKKKTSDLSTSHSQTSSCPTSPSCKSQHSSLGSATPPWLNNFQIFHNIKRMQSPIYSPDRMPPTTIQHGAGQRACSPPTEQQVNVGHASLTCPVPGLPFSNSSVQAQYGSASLAASHPPNVPPLPDGYIRPFTLNHPRPRIPVRQPDDDQLDGQQYPDHHTDDYYDAHCHAAYTSITVPDYSSEVPSPLPQDLQPCGPCCGYLWCQCLRGYDGQDWDS